MFANRPFFLRVIRLIRGLLHVVSSGDLCFRQEILTTNYADDTDELLRVMLKWTAVGRRCCAAAGVWTFRVSVGQDPPGSLEGIGTFFRHWSLLGEAIGLRPRIPKKGFRLKAQGCSRKQRGAASCLRLRAATFLNLEEVAPQCCCPGPQSQMYRSSHSIWCFRKSAAIPPENSRLWPVRVRFRRNAFGVETPFPSLTQGSSFLATLGFEAKSLWRVLRNS